MRLNTLMATLLSLCLMTTSYGQGWERMYEGDTISAHYIDLTVDGGYFIGAKEYTATPGQNTYLIKVDVNGDTLWTKSINNLGLTSGAKVSNSFDHVLAGNVLDFNTFKMNAGMTKVDATGNTLWSRSYPNTFRSNANSVQQTTDGGYILAGYKDLSGSYWNSDAYLIKTDASGNVVWTQTYGGSTYEVANSVQQTTDGGYIFVGNQFATAGSYASSDIYVVKTNASGAVLWTQTYGGGDEEVAKSIEQTADGGYIIGGHTKSFGAGNKDVYLIKIDATGTVMWTQTYGGSDDDMANSVVQGTDGGYLVTGDTYDSGVDNDIYILKTDPLGTVEWSKKYGTTEDDYGAQGTRA